MLKPADTEDGARTKHLIRAPPRGTVLIQTHEPNRISLQIFALFLKLLKTILRFALAEKMSTTEVENRAVLVPLLLAFILIAVRLKARRVTLTVLILISVIAFQSGRSTVVELPTPLPATHSKTGDVLRWGRWSVPGL